MSNDNKYWITIWCIIGVTTMVYMALITKCTRDHSIEKTKRLTECVKAGGSFIGSSYNCEFSKPEDTDKTRR